MGVTGLDGQTSLHRVADRGREGALDALISLGAEINSRDSKGRTPLHLASAKAKGKACRNFPSLSTFKITSFLLNSRPISALMRMQVSGGRSRYELAGSQRSNCVMCCCQVKHFHRK